MLLWKLPMFYYTINSLFFNFLSSLDINCFSILLFTLFFITRVYGCFSIWRLTLGLVDTRTCFPFRVVNLANLEESGLLISWNVQIFCGLGSNDSTAFGVYKALKDAWELYHKIYTYKLWDFEHVSHCDDFSENCYCQKIGCK